MAASRQPGHGAGPRRPRPKSVIQIFLWGGMSHIDTWDPKPDAGHDYMGEFAKVDPHQRRRASRSASCFPQLAKQADKYLAHPQHDPPQQRPRDGRLPDADRPHAGRAAGLSERRGRVLRCSRGPDYKGLIPPYVVLTRAAGAVLRGGLPGPEVQAVRHRRRPERAAVRGGRRRRPGHHRRPAEGPPRPARQAEHDGPRHGRQPAAGGRRGGQAAGLRADPGQGQGGLRPLQGEAGAAGPLRPPHLRAGLPGGAADGRGGRALRRHQLSRAAGTRTATTSRPCAGSARNWTRAWRRCWRT